MAFFRGDFRSSTLEIDTGLSVILPYDRPFVENPEPCKVLYLLHGLGGNNSTWSRCSSIELDVREKNIAVIMPEVQASFYMDMAYGMPYYTYITEELPAICQQFFGISPRREDTFVAGLSMGGYGAMRCGLARPDRYAGCASFSGPLDIRDMAETEFNRIGSDLSRHKAILGSDLVIPRDADLFYLADRLAGMPAEQWPRIYISCGESDFLFQHNLDFTAHMRQTPVPFTWESWPGDHDWTFWNVSVKKAIAFFLEE